MVTHGKPQTPGAVDVTVVKRIIFYLQARALFEFSSGAEGELSFGDAEILTITRQVSMVF